MAKELSEQIDAARAAARFARDVREHHRRRSPKESSQRQADIKIAQQRVAAAMRPLRSFLGVAPHKPQTKNFQKEVERARKASKALQDERRKLWKMAH